MDNAGINAVPGRAKFPCTPVPPAREIATLEDDAREGLLSSPRSLPPKYFYDDHGAALFERICDTGEYYPTRTEDALLRRYAADILAASHPDEILELGSGSSRKTRRLLDAYEQLNRPCRYLPFDVCREALEQAAAELETAYPWLEVQPLLGDYHAGLDNLPRGSGTRLCIFLGSTIGNFAPEQARRFVTEVFDILRPGDYFLLGADRVKDAGVIRAAYNDARGVTAQFNLNLLRVLNRGLNADFEVDGFRHHAQYNDSLSRIEMYLVSRRRQSVHLRSLGKTLDFAPGDRILTELSHKFQAETLETLLTGAGFQLVRHFQPDNAWFSLLLGRVPG